MRCRFVPNGTSSDQRVNADAVPSGVVAVPIVIANAFGLGGQERRFPTAAR